MRRNPLLPALILLSLLGATVARSGDGESAQDDPFFQKRGIDDRAAFSVGYVSTTVETKAQIDSELGIGSTLLLERLFGLPTDRDYPRFQFYYRFSRKHRFDFQYMRTASSATAILLDDEITIGDNTFELNAKLGVSQTTRFGAALYRYAFVNDGKAEAGITAGLGFIGTDLELYGEITDLDGTTIRAVERLNETIPLPVAGVYTDFTLTRRLFLSVEGLLFNANYGDYAGNISDVRAAIRWYPAKWFGFGASWNRTRIDLDIERNRGKVGIDYLLEGPSVFVSFLVPGLK